MVRRKGILKNLANKRNNNENTGLLGVILSLFNFHNVNTCKAEDDSFFCKFSRFFSLFIMMFMFTIIVLIILFLFYKFTSKVRGKKRLF